jgi:PAS domain S-box-containing protein
MTLDRPSGKTLALGGLALVALGFAIAILVEQLGERLAWFVGAVAALAGLLLLTALVARGRLQARAAAYQQRTQAALHEAERPLRRLLDRIGSPIVGVDRMGRVDFVNRQFLALTGYAPEEIIGADWLVLCRSPHLGAEPGRDVQEQLRRELEAPAERSVPTRSGPDRIIAWNYEMRRDPEGRFAGGMGVGEDLTERRRHEEQLRQAQKREMIGQLASGAAHEVNNMLAVIQGHTDMLAQTINPNEPLFQNVDMIRRAVERTGGLIRQMLTLGRKPEGEARALDLNAAVADVEKMLRPMLGKGIELVTILEPDLGAVKADPIEIEQMILNLAINARDAMPNGGQLIIETANTELDKAYARVHADVQPGPYVLLVVSDTGSGMTEEVCSHLFEPFFSTKELGKGSGLGLSTVSGIVKQSKGHIKVFSIPGQGSTFRIYLPKVEGAATPASSVPC